MKIIRITGGTLEENAYIIYSEESKNCFIIDPGYAPVKHIEEIKKRDLNPMGIILTHHHYDHVGAVKRLSEYFNIPVMIHKIDSFMVDFKCDRFLEHGDIISLDDEENLEVLHTPGHTSGSISLVSHKSKVVFTGDTLFDTDLGRTDLEDGSESSMRDSVRNVLNKLPNDYVIYPGHDRSANMKYVRKYNMEFLSCLE